MPSLPRAAVRTVALSVMLTACAGVAPAGSPQTASATPAVPSTSPLPTSSPVGAAADRVEDILDAHSFSGAALVARGDEVLYRGAMGLADVPSERPNAPETRFKAASVHKQLDAALILSLAEDGVIDISGSLCQGIDDCPPSLQDVTYHHVLTHTSGIGEMTDEEAGGIDSNESAMQVIGDRPREFDPGEGWWYSSTAWSLLSATPELVTGRPYPELLEEHVYDPAGLRDTELTGFDGPVPDAATGYADAGGEPVGGTVGTWTTVDDLRRWHEALSDGSVLKADSIATMETAHVETDPGVAYGYGVEIRTVEGHREVAHRGGTSGFTGWLVRFPDDDLVIVLLSNVETGNVDRIRDELVELVLESD